ncbi:MAG TPA: hypothetical protein VF266_02155 [Thermoanaerobaculia bacterium]
MPPTTTPHVGRGFSPPRAREGHAAQAAPGQAEACPTFGAHIARSALHVGRGFSPPAVHPEEA